MVDVVIVGAGPAGAYAAYLLAGHGLDVLIVDKEDIPRDKVCGGGISKKTTDLLEFDVSPVVQQDITGSYLTYRNCDTVVRDFASPVGAMTLRRDFDRFLLDRATDRGARFRPGTAFVDVRRRGDTVEVETSSGSLRARYLLGADGVFSRVRRVCFAEGLVTYAPAISALVRVPARVLELFRGRVLFDFGGIPKGYGWIFPKRDHLNVGLFSVFPSRDIRAQLTTFMSRYATLRNPHEVKVRGFGIPVKNHRGQFQDRNIWLLGDAAGLAEAFYGEGIFFALASAKLAAASLVEWFDDPSSRHYSERVRHDLLPDLFYSRVMARLFFSFSEWGFQRMVRSGRVGSYFVDLLAGRIGARECFYRTLLTAPSWLWSGRPHPVANVEL